MHVESDSDVLLRTDEMIGALNEFVPATLAKLRVEYPSEGMVLAVGQTLGVPELSSNIHARVTLEFLVSGVPLAEQGIEVARARLVQAQWVEFATQIITTVGSATTAGLALGKLSNGGTASVAFITLFGSLTALFVQFRRGSLLGGKTSLVEHYADLTALSTQMQFAKSEIQAVFEHGSPEDFASIKDLVGSGNEMALRLRKSLNGIGFAVGRYDAARPSLGPKV